MRRSLPVGLILFGCIFGAYGSTSCAPGGSPGFAPTSGSASFRSRDRAL
jgi:hypothetical protein